MALNYSGIRLSKTDRKITAIAAFIARRGHASNKPLFLFKQKERGKNIQNYNPIPSDFVKKVLTN